MDIPFKMKIYILYMCVLAQHFHSHASRSVFVVCKIRARQHEKKILIKRSENESKLYFFLHCSNSLSQILFINKDFYKKKFQEQENKKVCFAILVNSFSTFKLKILSQIFEHKYHIVILSSLSFEEKRLS